MSLDAKNKGHKTIIKAALKAWLASGMLVTVTREDKHREKKTYVEVGEWASD